MVDFLAPFNGFKDLFLIFDFDFANKYYIEMILRYRDILRRLVFYKRQYYIIKKTLY